ncbi:hypothetical protein AG1IA_00335 [Rhizoctonia solani AG-1 IA]|uniref:Uncharacterized protein n=1 Tax=Thanatephorus cucumeris (strain AG1-IA) TaxID=983506 RepID=L8X5M6_THACA|nr:hypothetical protein AG1IA_00335 [Rhizoctonia solani AG-1 IA]
MWLSLGGSCECRYKPTATRTADLVFHVTLSMCYAGVSTTNTSFESHVPPCLANNFGLCFHLEISFITSPAWDRFEGLCHSVNIWTHDETCSRQFMNSSDNYRGYHNIN